MKTWPSHCRKYGNNTPPWKLTAIKAWRVDILILDFPILLNYGKFNFDIYKGSNLGHFVIVIQIDQDIIYLAPKETVLGHFSDCVTSQKTVRPDNTMPENVYIGVWSGKDTASETGTLVLVLITCARFRHI